MELNILILFYILLSGAGNTLMSDINYPVSSIPVDLINGNHAVIRQDLISFEFISQSSSRLYRKRVVTIYDENADYYNSITVNYDKNSKITKFSGRIFNKFGEQIEKLKSSDIIDHSAVDGFSLYLDDRIKAAKLITSEYPYTIEFEFEKIFYDLYYTPNWMPITREHVSIENSEMIISIPKEMKIRYKECNLSDQVKPSEIDNKIVYHWKITNMNGFQSEPYMLYFREIFPVVFTAPVNFEIDGRKGEMSTWKDYGKWIYKLNEGRDSLPPSAHIKIRNLISGISDKKEQVKKIYEYLQSNTRYISVQLGIGGLQTYDAGYVENNGYGDCKALSNYMHSMLKVINIQSYSTLVNSGDGLPDILYDFPSDQFNHVILCVPVEKDTLWLECTDLNKPFGFMGNFTGNRHVLIITENGGVLSKTKAYSKEMNLQSRTGEVNIMPDGTATANIATVSSGLQYDDVRHFIYADRETQKKELYRIIDVPDFNLEDFSFSEDKNNPSTTENIKLTLNRYLTISGKRIFFLPNLMNQSSSPSTVKDTRQYDIEFIYPYIDIDSIIFNFPSEYHLEFLPKLTEVSSRFGTYSSKILTAEGKLIYIRKMERNSGKFPRESYSELKDFIQKIYTTDKMKLVLIKST